MGRFDALTKLEEKTEIPAQNVAVKSPTLQKSVSEPEKSGQEVVKKPEFMKTRKPEKVSSTIEMVDKPEKYSTLLEATLIKKIKIFAAEREIKDYEVIARALTEYFEKNK
jgi:hypothetical protein